ncbi:acetaldehyde dehydrogenase (acetylating) [Gimibacter soli]|uniref:Acetaldehyde dehydrogenase n=1 Tax=Gimibacter soli TaxID=3024400 RepID=A0AAF0BGC5_9PROT|nr:acetaldehyde dehydrogenase (acetylating) [Gimibacter soli]WCL53338.1 acetaldehyde dehydrogenase (acetylating) [Gimibacter soli]
MAGKVKCAIIGSGNIGTDLMLKIVKADALLEAAVVIGIDAQSEGLALARSHGVATFHEGLAAFMGEDLFSEVDIFFDATSAKAHLAHDKLLADHPEKTLIDLTPAAIGPYTVPVVNLGETLGERNVNMVTCGGQATIPMVAAVARVAPVRYAEIVASISSRSAGPGTRANIDEFTETTSRAIERVGGAARGKAIIVLNPAEPPLLMRNTVYVLSDEADEQAIRASVAAMAADVQSYVPGYRLKQDVQFERFGNNNPLEIPGYGTFTGIKSSIFLEVEGAADYLPAYAGNLDIMTSAARGTGERIAAEKYGRAAA